jgi:1,4-alpha-glucan branching enzyme
MKKNTKHHHTKSVEISCFAPEAREVLFGGTFNGWDASSTPMERLPKVPWSVTLELAPGTYEYNFLVDGNWACQHGTDESDPALLDPRITSRMSSDR